MVGRGVRFSKALGLLAAAFLLSAAPAHATSITRFDIANTPNKNLVFTAGGSFTFQDEIADSNNDFNITLQDGGAGLLVGLTGDIDGTFTFGDPNGAVSVTVVSSIGAVFTISDGAGQTFSAPISFVELTEFNLGSIHIGGIAGTVVLGAATYNGANADLQALAQFPTGEVVISFQNTRTLDLDALYDNGNGAGTSWSGTINPTPTPEPGSLLLLGSGLVGIVVAARRKKTK